MTLKHINIAFLTYIFCFTLSKFVNSGFDAGLGAFMRTCQDYFVFLWAFYFVSKSIKNEKLIYYAVLTAAIISIFYGLLQFFHLDVLHRQEDISKLTGFHKNSYTYGGQLIIVFFFLLTALINNKNKLNNALSLFLVALAFLCLLNTSERAVILGSIVGLVVYLFFSRVKNEKLYKVISAIVLIPTLITYFFNKKLVKRITNVINPKMGSKPNVRFKLWQIALSIWKRNVFFGSGKFPAVYHEVSNEFPMQVLSHAHNVYLQILVTNGVIGLFGFLNLFFAFLRALFKDLKTNKYAPCFLSIILAFCVEGVFEYFWGDSEVRYLILYFAGFVFGSMINYKEKRI